MARSLKKGPYIDEKLISKLKTTGKSTVVKTWARECTIVPEMVGFKIAVHNGKEHIEVRIIEEMVGHKLGEFSPTRKFRKHGGKIARAQEQQSTQAAPAAKEKE
jgi:small subunit ribosomal protein S19